MPMLASSLRDLYVIPFCVAVSEHGSVLRMKGAISPELSEAKEMSETKETAKAKSASLKRPTKIRMASFK